MNILIVESQLALGEVWRRHLQRCGSQVALVESQQTAILALQETRFDAIVLDLVLTDGSAFGVADFASYRQPDAKIIFVTNTSFFSDGSIFKHFANARAYVPSHTAPEDLAAIVTHYSSLD